MVYLWLPRWHWPEYGEARFYGWRHSLVIGRLMVFWGRMSAAEIESMEADK